MFFKKIRAGKDFSCYAFMVDYENMGLEWPDGYETEQVQEQAPVGVIDNYLFFAKDDKLYKLDFGGFKEQVTTLAPGAGAAFNRGLESVALKNEEKEKNFSQLSNLISAFEVITRLKHGEDNDVDDMTAIMIAGMLEGLLEKLSQRRANYKIELSNDPDSPTKEGQIALGMHISVDGQEVMLESVLDDIDGAAFRPALNKIQIANIDLYGLWADWGMMPSEIRPTGYENQRRCPVGINNNDIVFNMNGMIYQINALNGRVDKLPFENVMSQLEVAANQSDAYFKHRKMNSLDFLIGKFLAFAMEPRNVNLAADIAVELRNVWRNCAYRMTTENVIYGRGNLVSTRNNRPVTLEEMIETL